MNDRQEGITQSNCFELHPRIKQDSLFVGNFKLCELRLQNDCHYPWFILIPRRPNITEIFQLATADQRQLLTESSYLAENLQQLYHADKINIAAIGNLVPQLHIHHIVRYKHDKAWPAPVWGKFPTKAYAENILAVEIAKIRGALKQLSIS